MRLLSSARRTTLSLFLVAIVLLFGCSSSNEDQPNSKKAATLQAAPTVAIFNLMSHPILDASVAGIKAGLAEAGYSGVHVKLVEFNANGEMDKLNAFAKEVLSGTPNVIVPVSTPVTQVIIKEAPEGQQVVFSTVTNPADVRMDRYSKYVTGVSDVVNYEANLDLIQELFPEGRHIGMIYNPGERNSEFGIQRVRQLIESRPLDLELVPVSRSDQVADAMNSLVGRIDVLYIGSDNTVVGAIAGVLKVARVNGIPVIASDAGSVEQGALAAVSVNYEELGRRAGTIVAEVLRGRNAGSIPNVLFVGHTLIINERAAEAMKFTFPASVRERANQVIQ